MSDYLDRLEHELLSAGRRYHARPARGGRAWRLPRMSTTAGMVVSLAVTVAVIVVVAGAGLVHTGSHSAPASRHHSAPATQQPSGPITPQKISTAPACRWHGTSPPPLDMSDGTPDRPLQSILSIARTPGDPGAWPQLKGFDREPPLVLTVFRRYLRLVSGARGVRLAFFPAVICDEVDDGSPGHPATRVRIFPTQAMMMVVLSNPGPHPVVFGGTTTTILHGPAVPGLDLADNRGWIQATIVPDGVAKVVMHFTPPFLHHYTVTVPIHDNLGVAVRNPDYTPTTVSWYGSDGHLIHTFVDRRDLNAENCLAQHRKNCP